MIKIISVESYDAMCEIIDQKTKTIEEQMQIIQMLREENLKQSCIICGLKEMLKAKPQYVEGSDEGCTTEIDFLGF